ncbi:hypothetical protein CC78DRAFT_159921 [Lojkania enalia]|uniref:Uncharacterized protein n=1 Tax=Lojkania enalia TaxID=147567 RepID=A0A9P4KDE4_9PLEO|nr:hypothetical protein CC78DRAFT_159921 [Didymosphaeria enalia]
MRCPKRRPSSIAPSARVHGENLVRDRRKYMYIKLAAEKSSGQNRLAKVGMFLRPRQCGLSAGLQPSPNYERRRQRFGNFKARYLNFKCLRCCHLCGWDWDAGRQAPDPCCSALYSTGHPLFVQAARIWLTSARPHPLLLFPQRSSLCVAVPRMP